MTITPTASPDLSGLDNLETQARAADQDGQHIYTNPRDYDNWRANEIWHYLASPAAVLALIALARRAQQAAAPDAKQWTDKEIADACVQAGLGILECNALLVTLKRSAAQLDGSQEGSAS
jgi:hypothetical protein